MLRVSFRKDGTNGGGGGAGIKAGGDGRVRGTNWGLETGGTNNDGAENTGNGGHVVGGVTDAIGGEVGDT